MMRSHFLILLTGLAFAGSKSLAGQTVTVPPPGACEAPAAANRGKPGCYLTVEIPVQSPTDSMYWHIVSFESEKEANTEASRHKVATVTESHGRIWLHVLGAQRDSMRTGVRKAVVGPIRPVSNRPHIARFLEADFTPGMITRTHSHSGPEAFYVVSGEQCVETPTDKRTLLTGETYIVERGVHLQSAPKGRKNLVLVLHEAGTPWTTVETQWTPSGYCNS